MTARVTATTGTKYAATPSRAAGFTSAAIRNEVNGIAVANRPRARSKTHCCVSIDDSGVVLRNGIARIPRIVAVAN